MTVRFAGHERAVAGVRQLVGDVGTGVAQAHDQHRPVGELVRTAVVGRVELANARDRGGWRDPGTCGRWKAPVATITWFASYRRSPAEIE